MIKGVICDLDGAYFIDGKANFVKNIVNKYKVTKEDVETLFFSSDLMMNYKRGEINDSEYWREFTKKFEIEARKEELIEILINGYKQDEKIVDLIKKLKGENFKTIICSNNFPARINGLEKKFNFLENFTTKVFSYDVGKLKLEGFEMFQQVVYRSELQREEILIFDNGKENIAHAREFGLTAIWYEDNLQLLKDLEKMGIRI